MKPWAPSMAGEVVEFAQRQVDRSPAFLADDVMMFALVDQVNYSGTVTEMNMAQMTGGGEDIDSAVDRRWIHF